MKRLTYFFTCVAVVVACAVACDKPEQNINEEKPNEEKPNEEKPNEEIPTCELVSLNATPVGDTLTFALSAEGAWTIAADDCDWVTADPASGTGDADVTFYVTANNQGKDRSVSFFVTEGEYEIYEVFISQVKMELPIHEGDQAFLQWLVENKAYGDNTPEITDWYSFTGEGFPAINFGVDAAGKMFIQSIELRANADNYDQLFNSFPPVMNLQNLERIYINYTEMGTAQDAVNCPLKGSEFPQEWDCPKLYQCHLECVGMVGTIPDSFAALPELCAFFVRSCDFYGALPHEWKSGKLESVVLGFNGAGDCPNLGYLLPASLDVILNSEKPDPTHHTDKNEFKIGGQANWSGYEAGWGQKRYEKFDPNAVKGDMYVWSDYRKLTQGTAEENAPGGIRNPLGTDNARYIDDWAWYFQALRMPNEMLDWDQNAADAYTATAAAMERLYTR